MEQFENICNFLPDNFQSCIKFGCKLKIEHGFHQTSVNDCILCLAIGANYCVYQDNVSVIKDHHVGSSEIVRILFRNICVFDENESLEANCIEYNRHQQLDKLLHFTILPTRLDFGASQR